MKKARKRVFIFLLSGILSASMGVPPLKADNTSPSVIYRFGENLLGAEAVSISNEGEILGKWRDEGFLFKGLGDQAAIKVETQEVDGVSREIITFNPIEKTTRRLRFSEVPGGSKLSIYYFTRKDPELKQVTYLYLSIWVGRHLIRKLPVVVSEDGWKQSHISLGILPFLNTDTVFTFELSGQGVHNLQFSFSADMEA